jgi:sec-independent protein translocase protein TatC
MYLLKKAIQLREKSHPDHEKPFLEHLEDLRVMVTKMVVTLVIAMIACFAFNKDLMAFFRRPVEKVLVTQIQATLPPDAPHPLTVEKWGEARKIEHAAMSLTPEQRETFYRSLPDKEIVLHSRSVSILRAAMVLPEAGRVSFIDALPEGDDLKKQVKTLLVTKPRTDTDVKGNLNMMSGLKPTEAFMLSMKLSFVAGVVVSFPLLLLFVLQFVLPGLHSHEKKVLWPAMTIGFGLFLTGAAFAYYMVLPRALLFFAEWSEGMGISNDWRIGEYISFATQFTLLFGLSFELPVVVMVFVKLGLLSYETMSKTRSYAIVGIFVAAAVLTPTPDAFTLMLMALPMIILYEICIWLAYFDQKKARVLEEQEARERVERQLLREKELRAEEEQYPAKNDTPHAETPVDKEKPQHDAHDEAGDDGWHEEYPQQDRHASDELPDIGDKPPHDVPEDGERRRMDP